MGRSGAQQVGCEGAIRGRMVLGGTAEGPALELHGLGGTERPFQPVSPCGARKRLPPP